MNGRVIHYDIGYITDIGNVRNTNQDSLLVRRGNIGKQEFVLTAVADGMGGLSRGEEASAQAVNTLDQWWNDQLPDIVVGGLDWAAVKNSLIVAIDQINWTLYSQIQEGKEKSGTTLTLAFLHQNRYQLLQIGDSRAYLINRTGLKQLTKDQTWCQREIDAGRLLPAAAESHPMRHVLISSLGVAPQYILDQYQGKMAGGECLLLCSDGFYNEVDEKKLWLNNSLPAQAVLDGAATQIRSGTSSDNFTAVLLRLTKTYGWRS